MGLRRKTSNNIEPKPKKVRGTIDIETIGKRASVVAYAFMLAAIGSIFVLSWDGLTHFGEKVLGLDGWMVHIVPGSLDGSVIMFGCMAIVSMIAGENATGLRFFVQLCAVGSAVFNGYQGWISADKDNRYFAGAYYACLSLLVALIAHWFFRRIRRAARIEDGTLKVDTVHFSMAEWTKFPIRRWKARTLALEYGITDPRLAITLEASKNRRIDPRVMHALEAYRNDESSRVYEFFPMQSEPESHRKAIGKRRKSQEWSTGTTVEVKTEKTTPEEIPEMSEQSIGMPELTTGTDTGIPITTEVTTEETTHDPVPDVAGYGRPDRPEEVPESPESAGQEGSDPLGFRCVGVDSSCDCTHRNALESFRNQSEAVDYGHKVSGINGGTELRQWLLNHGRKVGTSTVYDTLKASTGTGQVVPFRRSE